MSRGSATVNSTYCSQVIFETSIVTCARAGRIAKAVSGSANNTRLNLFISDSQRAMGWTDVPNAKTALVAPCPLPVRRPIHHLPAQPEGGRRVFTDATGGARKTARMPWGGSAEATEPNAGNGVCRMVSL